MDIPFPDNEAERVAALHTYDIWGDAVNIAALMESNGAAGRITLSESTYHRVKDIFETEPRGKIEAKHKGRLDTYFLARLKPELAQDESGRIAKGGRFSAAE